MPGVVVTIIFALPPIIRLTILGIKQVPADLVEAAESFGASPRQMLFKSAIAIGNANHYGRGEPNLDVSTVDGRYRLNDCSRRLRPDGLTGWP